MESQRECVTYGSIISFKNDFISGDETPTLSYDPSIQYINYFKQKKENFLDFLTSRFFLSNLRQIHIFYPSYHPKTL